MRRIDSSNVQQDKFGAGKHGFQGGNPATNTPATFLTANWHDALQEEIANVIEYFGIALDPSNNAQLVQILTTRFVLATDFAGEIGKVSFVPATQANAGHLPLFGAEFNRVGAYAPLWAYAQASGTLVDDATFGSRPGCFGYGSGGPGGTTFRVPKIAGLVIKAYHNGDGTYTTDLSPAIGQYRPDQLLSHAHVTPISSNVGTSNNRSSSAWYTESDRAPDRTWNWQTSASGQPENTVRSVILFPQIRYR
jgi:microcystin-dependent protein